MKNLIIFYLLIIIFLNSCKEKEELICDIDTCLTSIEESTIPALAIVDSSIAKCYFECNIDCQFEYPSNVPYKYLYPYFNPSNSDQLVYYRKASINPTSVGYELWVKNFCTGEQQMITDQAFYGIDWSIKDWIVYTGTDQNIWKIKSNGDSLTQLTSIGSFNRHPKWNPNGNKIAYNAEIQGSTNFYIMDEFGNNIETIEEMKTSGRWCWINDDEICYNKAVSIGMISATELNVYNLNSEESRFLHKIEHVNSTTGFLDSLILDIEKSPNENSIVWSAIGLIGKTDLSTGSFQVLKDKLFHEKFYSLTVRPNSKEILISKGADYYVDYCNYYTDYGFFLIDQEDGANYRQVVVE